MTTSAMPATNRKFHVHDVSRDRKRHCKTCVAKTLLVLFFGAYLLLGAYMFLVIETHQGVAHQHTPPMEEIRTALGTPDLSPNDDDPLQHQKEQQLSRTQLLDRLWDITESLNILYKENWTRLAADEMMRFHNSIEQQYMSRECGHHRKKQSTNPSIGGAQQQPQHAPVTKWTYPSALLYALSVITTLGPYPIPPVSTEGKLLTIVYAVFGVPLLLFYLHVIGSSLSAGLMHCWPIETHQRRDLYSVKKSSGDQTSGRFDVNGRIYWPIVVCLAFLFAYIGIGVWLFSNLLLLPVTEALLLSFMLFTTIGIPESKSNAWTQTAPQLAASLYVVLGLTLTSFCVNVVYELILLHWASAPMADETPASSTRRSS